MQQTLSGATSSIPAWFLRVAPRAGIFALLWWILTGGDWASWGVGVPVLVASTYASFLLRSPHAWRWNVVGLARFLPVFVWFSLRGGLDVAQRALHPHCPLAPELLVYPLRLSVGPAQIFFANTVSLLPGTLSVELKDNRLTVHILDANLPILDILRYLESLVSGLFGLHVSSTLIYPIHCPPKVVYRNGLAMLAASLVLVGFGVMGGQIVPWQGGLMVAILIVFIAYSYWTEKYRMAPSATLHQHEAEEIKNDTRPLWLNALSLGVGLAAIMGGASMLIDGAVTIARAAGISEAVIGLTLVAIGTSLPELATSMIAAVRKHADVAIGNILGSNIFNILSVLGFTALVRPVPISPEMVDDIWIMMGVAVILLPVLLTGHRLSRTEAVLFLAAYSGYIGWLYSTFPITADTLGL